MAAQQKQWGVWAERSAASVLGPAQAWLKEFGVVVRTDEAQAKFIAALRNESRMTMNVFYTARPFDQSPEGV